MDARNMAPHMFDVHERKYLHRSGEWCKHCNLARNEVRGMHPKDGMDRDEFHDFVVVHGVARPTEAGYKLGVELLQRGDDYATAACEVVCRGLTTDAEVLTEDQLWKARGRGLWWYEKGLMNYWRREGWDRDTRARLYGWKRPLWSVSNARGPLVIRR
jgi:hypothetical protein